MTMTELARLADLDVSTVSRALRSDNKRVAEETIRRVHRLAEKHDFRADPVAAALRSGRSQMIGVLVPSMSDAAVATMLEGIAQEAADTGYLAALTPTGGDTALRRKAIGSYLDRRADGVILADSPLRGAVPRDLRASKVPFVLALRTSGTYPHVVADDELGGRLAAAHLLSRGHRDVCVIAGPSNASTAARRLHGFTSTLAAEGVELSPDRIMHSQFGVDDGHRAMDLLLERGRTPTAVFALNDYNAIGAARALQNRGITVGTDVALVGYNDISISAELQVPLTSVHNELEVIGRLAVRALIARLGGEETESVMVPPRLVVRESSDLPRPG